MKRVICPLRGSALLTDVLGLGKSALNGWPGKLALRCFYIYIISIRVHHPGFCCGIQAKQDLKSLWRMVLFIPQGVFNSVSLKEYKLLDLMTQR